jgi:hypothetical protein
VPEAFNLLQRLKWSETMFIVGCHRISLILRTT